MVVEGPTEKRVYGHWVPLTNPVLSVVSDINKIKNNNVFIVSGGGYPHYFNTIESGVKDVTENSQFDRFVVAIDSEEMTFDEKYNEVKKRIDLLNVELEYKIIVQHFCIETWALGNKVIVTRNPDDPKIKQYKKIFDVLHQDPELLPKNTKDDLNRSQFADSYLRKLLNEKYKNLTYTKSNPEVLLNDTYYDQVKSRFQKTGHIPSFKGFIEAFS